MEKQQKPGSHPLALKTGHCGASREGRWREPWNTAQSLKEKKYRVESEAGCSPTPSVQREATYLGRERSGFYMQPHKLFQVMTPDAMRHGTKTRYGHGHFNCDQTAQHAHNPSMSLRPENSKEENLGQGRDTFSDSNLLTLDFFNR